MCQGQDIDTVITSTYFAPKNTWQVMGFTKTNTVVYKQPLKRSSLLQAWLLNAYLLSDFHSVTLGWNVISIPKADSKHPGNNVPLFSIDGMTNKPRNISCWMKRIHIVNSFFDIFRHTLHVCISLHTYHACTQDKPCRYILNLSNFDETLFQKNE